MTPMQCASLMMRNHADPGLIAAYLALELERDPRIAMRPWQRLIYEIEQAMGALRSAVMPARDALALLGAAFADPPTQPEDLVLWPPRS